MVITYLINAIKIAPWAILVLSVVFIVRGFTLVKGGNRILFLKSVPQPYGMVYSLMKKIPFISKDMGTYKMDLYLVLGTTDQMLVDKFLCIYASISTFAGIAASVLAIKFVPVWYWSVIIIFFCVTVPYLAITNNIGNKAELLRIQNISCYESAERFFSDGNQPYATFCLIESTVNGPLKKLYTNFKNSYYLDPDQAYEEYVKTINDRFGLAFIKAVISFDEIGIDPCKNISGNKLLAMQHYRATRSTRNGYSGYRKLGMGMLLIVGAFAFSATQLLEALGGKNGAEFLTYLSIVAILSCVFISYVYERV